MNKFNSLTENKDEFIKAHLRREAKYRRSKLSQEPFPWVVVVVLILVAIGTAIGVGELIF